MTDNLERSIDALPLTGYSADNVYRVKPMDRDSGGNANEQFHDHLKEKEKEESGEQNNGESDTGTAGQDALKGGISTIRDDVILSDSAREMLKRTDDDGESSRTDRLPAVTEENESPGRNTAQRIDVVA